MNDQVTDLIYRNGPPAALDILRKQFTRWKKYSQRFREEHILCQQLAARYHANERRRSEGGTDTRDLNLEDTNISNALIRLNSKLPDAFWAEEAEIVATAQQGQAPTGITSSWGSTNNTPEPPQTSENYVPNNPQAHQPQHDPSHVFGRWQLVRVVQDNVMIPLTIQETAIYNRDHSFYLVQNNVQTAWGKFSYSGIELVINLANGFVDRRKFTCHGSSLLLLQEGSGVYSFYQRVG